MCSCFFSHYKIRECGKPDLDVALLNGDTLNKVLNFLIAAGLPRNLKFGGEDFTAHFRENKNILFDWDLPASSAASNNLVNSYLEHIILCSILIVNIIIR